MVIYKVISRKIINKTYNVCNDDQVSIVEFIDLIFKIIGKKTGIRHTRKDGAIFKDELCIFSNQLVKNDLNIKFKNLNKGINEYIVSKK